MKPPGNWKLIHLLHRYDLNITSLAYELNIELEEGYSMLRGENVSKDSAEKVLKEINSVSGMKYSLAELGIEIEEKGNGSE